MYKKVLCEVIHGSKKLDKVPFVIDREGFPFEPINAFIRARLFESNRNGLTTVGAKVNKIIAFLCFLDTNGRNWSEATHDRVRQFREQGGINRGGGRERKAVTINGYISTVYEFYWWCEQNKFCEGVIGITNTDQSEYLYPLFVYPPRQGGQGEYEAPNLLKTPPVRIRAKITAHSEWLSAYEQALDDDSPIGQRNALLILFILETGARRSEAQSTHIDQFRDTPSPKQKTMSIHVRKTKNSEEGRYLTVPLETYLEIQTFIEDGRDELISHKGRDAGYLFCSKSGKALSDSYFNKILGKHGLRTHDGRSSNLTEFFIEQIRRGIDEETAILLAQEHAGHSQSDRSARTLKQHYLQAKAIEKASKTGTYLDQEKRMNEKLQLQLQKAQETIAELEQMLQR